MHTSKKRIYGEARFSRWLEFQEERRERRKDILDDGSVSSREENDNSRGYQIFQGMGTFMNTKIETTNPHFGERDFRRGHTVVSDCTENEEVMGMFFEKKNRGTYSMQRHVFRGFFSSKSIVCTVARSSR